jgi:hypothetical protein
MEVLTCNTSKRIIYQLYFFISLYFFPCLEEELVESLVAYQFGLFGNEGSGNGTAYPEQYSVGKHSFPNRGCSSGENVSKNRNT